MKTNNYLILSLLCLLQTAGAGDVDVAGGNHQTIVLTPENHVLSFGQDLHIGTDEGKDFIGGKLGRPIDSHVLPGKDPKSIVAQANYNPVPAKVQGLDGLSIARLAIGQNDAAAITTDGDVYVWGPNDHGQLGLGDETQRRSAIKVPFPADVKISAVDFGGAHMLALATDGRVFSCGNNQNGQLGLGDEKPRLKPTLIEALKDVKIIQVAAGQNTHSLFLAENGTLYVSGSNKSKEIGLGPEVPEGVNVATAVKAPVPFKFVAVGVKTSFAIDRDGNLWGAGDGSKAHFGFTTPDGKPDLKDLPTFTRLPNAPANLIAVGGGSRHVAVIDDQGAIYTWGIHATLSAQLGIGPPKVEPGMDELDGVTYSKPQLVALPEGRKATRLHVIANNVFVVTADQKVYGWGQTAHGRLGYGLKAVHSAVNANGRTLYHAHSPIEIPLTDDPSKIKLDP